MISILDGPKVRIYFLLLTIISCSISVHAHSITELDGTIPFSSENWPEYVEHNSVLAENWNYSTTSSSFLTPSTSAQVFGSSSFSIKPAFTHSKLSLSFYIFSNVYADLRDCNFYLIADQYELSFSEDDIHSLGFFNLTLSLGIPSNTQEIKIGALADSDCALTLSSITITEREEANDLDNDGIEDVNDNCPGFANSEQLDSNFDNIGDICTFDPSRYVDISEPFKCNDASNPDFNFEPDNDNDGIVDICDLDDDNDGISDIDEIRLGLDIFTPFDYDAGKRADPDNDNIFSNDEIKLGFDPNRPNFPPMIELGKYLLNHNNSQTSLTPFQGSIFNYTSTDNFSFSFGHNAVSNHFKLESEFLLTGTTIQHENIIFDDIEFEPAIRIFPSPSLINYQYERTNSIVVKNINADTGERESTPATIQIKSKVYLTDDQELLTYQYSYKIYHKDTSSILISSNGELMTWSETEGFIGLGLPDNLREVTTYTPPNTPAVPTEEENNTSTGYFSSYWFIVLFYFVRLVRTRPSRVMAMLR